MSLSTTPQFDKALNENLEGLKPRDQKCNKCGESFSIREEDISFYRVLKVPPPTICPLCRKKRRFAHLVRLPKFFKRKCGALKHTEEIITIFPPETSHKLYDFSYWHSDAWDPTDLGFICDANALFFPQFQKLFFAVPHPPLERDPRGVGVDYSLGGLGGKNNYYCSMAYGTENAAYCIDARFSRDVFDCNLIAYSELCYESVASYNCSRCVSVVSSSQCLDSAFLYDCKNCSRCFMSSNLRNRSYVFKNGQLTKEEYEKKISTLLLNKRSVFQKQRKDFIELINHSLHRSLQTRHTTDSIGDSLSECRNCYWVFRSEKSENVRYSDNTISTKDSMDVLNCKGELNYEGVVNAGNNLRFSMYVRDSSFLEYSSEMYNCDYCFGCVGLKNKKFHIFNRPYSEEEYWRAVDEIKTTMLLNSEYGEFFPLGLGLIPYQSSFAQKNFPIMPEEAKKSYIPWYDEPETKIPEGMGYKAAEAPEDIHDVSDEILEHAIICEKTGKPFRIVEEELSFYRRMKIPIPIIHPYQRMMERVKFENSQSLFPFTCPKCGEKSYSTYNLEQQKNLKIYCEKCYLREVV